MSTDGPQYPKYPGEQQPPPPPLPPPPPPPGTPPAFGSPPPSYPPPGPPTGPASYASWGARLGAYLLDSLFAVLVLMPFAVVSGVIAGATGEGGEINPDTGLYEGGTVNPLSTVFLVLAYMLYFAFIVWNWGYRQGRTGQSLGKGIAHIRVVRENAPDTPLGFWLAVGRWLLFGIITTCTLYINALWPLWDSKNQGLHDKAVSTVVIRS